MDMEDFERFPGVLKAGEPAPDGELVNAADGRRVRLSECWRSGPVVMEFGSIT
jgi:hypothetical protein